MNCSFQRWQRGGGGVDSKKTEGEADRTIECCELVLPVRHNKVNESLIYLRIFHMTLRLRRLIQYPHTDIFNFFLRQMPDGELHC